MAQMMVLPKAKIFFISYSIFYMDSDFLNFDVIVVGGGMGGTCAALASARHGMKTALIQNRPVLGGNASSEVRVHIGGAPEHGYRYDSRESGIIEEIRLEAAVRDPRNEYIWIDTVLYSICQKQANLTLFLNTHVYDLKTEDGIIISVSAVQLGTERSYELSGTIFIDGTGDGTLGALADADFRIGREASDEFNENNAPDEADDHTLGSSIMFQAEDTGEPVDYLPPDWAIKFTKEKLKHRRIYGKSPNFQEYWHSDSAGWWWIEYGGMIDTIHDNEEIRFHLQSIAYGIWDWIKNHDEATKKQAETFRISWISQIPGKRESRRLVGDYLLKESDLLDCRVFKDQIAVGGWSIDQHPPEGFYSEESGSHHTYMEQPYSIPYRCIYSRNVENLLIASRCISVTHVAHASTRLIATLACVGQAAGTAAAFCIDNDYLPSKLAQNDLFAYQQTLIRDDQWLIGIKNEDEKDLALDAEIVCNSKLPVEFGEPDRFIPLYFPMAQRIYMPALDNSSRNPIDLYLYIKNESDDVVALNGGLRLDNDRFEFKSREDLASFDVEIAANHDGWVKINNEDLAAIITKAGNYWFYLNESENLTWGKNESRHLTGFRLGYQDEDTKNWRTVRINGNPFFDRVIGFYGHLCFKFEGISTLFPCENLNNGFSRPYIGPNLWISSKMRPKPLKNVEEIKNAKPLGSDIRIIMNFKEPTEISEILFTFNTELNNSYPHQSYGSERIKDWPIGGKAPTCIRAMDIYGVLDSKEFPLGAIDENYQRCERVKLEDPVEVERLIMIPRANWGSDVFSLYEIRVY